MMAKRRRRKDGVIAPRGGRPGLPSLRSSAPGIKSPPRVGRPDLAALTAAVLGPLALYVATLPRTVVPEDDSLFLMVGAHLGVRPPARPVRPRSPAGRRRWPARRWWPRRRTASWQANDRSDSDFAERHAEMVFDLLPRDAVLFGYGD